MTSSRLFSLMSSSANNVGRSSWGASTGLVSSAKMLGGGGGAAATGRGAGREAAGGAIGEWPGVGMGVGIAGTTGAIRGGPKAGRADCIGARVVEGSGAPGCRAGVLLPGGAGCQTGCWGPVGVLGGRGAAGRGVTGTGAGAALAAGASTGGTFVPGAGGGLMGGSGGALAAGAGAAGAGAGAWVCGGAGACV